MKITLITVSFNSAKTIAETLKSVAGQTYENIEHILVDGGSTDSTLDIAKQYGGHLARLVSEPDQGIYDAMNKGIALASGDIVGFINSDDIYNDSSVIEKVVHLIQSNELDALYGDVIYFHEGNPEKSIRRYRSNRFSPKNISWGWMPAHPALFFRRSVYQQIGFFKTDYHIAGDFEFVARAFYANKLNYHYLPEVIVKMRIGGISTSGWRNSILLNKEVLRACRENDIDTNILKILSKYPQKAIEWILPNIFS